MKKLIVTTLAASVLASSAFAQGLISFSGGGSVATRACTNSVVGGGVTGATVATANQYYFALFASSAATGTTASGGTGSYAFSNLGAVGSAWELVGIGANIASLGRYSPVSQGSSSATQGALNTDNSLTVQGIAGGGTANLIAIGWSANIGSTLASVIAWYNNGNGVATTGWIGQSTMATVTLGDGGGVPTPPTWNTSTSFLMGRIDPIPEPATMALAGLGGLSLLALRRKK